jgi:tRNA G26 N,N-dimethylase Trm1
MTWMHGTEWPDSATWRRYLTSAMHRYSCCRNGVRMVLGQVLRDTASRLGTQIVPLEVSLLPGMAKTIHNIFQTLSHIYNIFRSIKCTLYHSNHTYNAALLRTAPSSFLCCHHIHSLLKTCKRIKHQATIYSFDSLGAGGLLLWKR